MEDQGLAAWATAAHLDGQRRHRSRRRGVDPSVDVQGRADPEGVPGAVGEPPRPPACTRNAVGTPEKGLAIRIEVPSSSSTNACASCRRRQPSRTASSVALGCVRDLADRRRPAEAHEQPVGLVPQPEVVRGHGGSLRSEGSGIPRSSVAVLQLDEDDLGLGVADVLAGVLLGRQPAGHAGRELDVALRIARESLRRKPVSVTMTLSGCSCGVVRTPGLSV